MTVHQLYTCNVCGKSVCEDHGNHAVVIGHPVTIDQDGRVSITKNFMIDTDAHICTKCARGIGACYVAGAFGDPVLDKALIVGAGPKDRK